MSSQTVRRILTINTGSSSLKVALYEAGREECGFSRVRSSGSAFTGVVSASQTPAAQH